MSRFAWINEFKHMLFLYALSFWRVPHPESLPADLAVAFGVAVIVPPLLALLMYGTRSRPRPM